MQIANIYPVKNQDMYKREKYVMVLAHLVKKNLYKAENFSEDQYIIMDNGLFEGEQVSTNLQDLVDLAETCGLPIKEIIVPDAINDCDKTKQLFRENIQIIKRYGHKYKFMFVAQSLTYSELRSNILFINQFPELNLSVGISKLSPLDRASMQAIQCYKHCKFPIHILGIKDSFDEIEKLVSIPMIRGCDTSQLANIAKNERKCVLLIWNYSRYARKGEDIQLEQDYCDPEVLLALKANFDVEASTYGIL